MFFKTKKRQNTTLQQKVYIMNILPRYLETNTILFYKILWDSRSVAENTPLTHTSTAPHGAVYV